MVRLCLPYRIEFSRQHFALRVASADVVVIDSRGGIHRGELAVQVFAQRSGG